MITLLSDYNCERQAKEILYHLRRLGYGEQLGIEILFFKDVNLSINSSDEEVWQFCQQNGDNSIEPETDQCIPDPNEHI